MSAGIGNLFGRKRIPAFLGIFVLLSGIIAGVVLISQQQGFSFSIKAGPTATPRQVRITNITDTSVVISWISDTSVSGFVKYGTEQTKLTKTLADDRDRVSGKTGLHTTHFITISGLKANTNYFFVIGSGSSTYDDTGKPYQVKTAKAAAKPAADTISGKVLLASGQPANGALVYVEVEGGSPMAAITKATGAWSLALSQTRTKDLESYLNYDKKTAKVNIFVQGAELGTATATVDTSTDSPVADISLGKSTTIAVATPSAGPVLSSPTLTIINGAFSPTDLTLAPGQTVSITNADNVSHAISARGGEFSTGEIKPAGKADFVTPTTPGKYVFFDSLNPQKESLVGSLTVVSGQGQPVANAIPTTSVTPGIASATTPTPTPTATATPTTTPTTTTTPTLTPTSTPAIGGTATASAVTVVSIAEGAKLNTTNPEIVVKAPAGTVVKITVNSNHTQVNTVVVDADGQVSWTPPAGLEPGPHTVTLEYVDSKGVTQKVVRSFTVLATATSPTVTKAVSLLATPTYSASVGGITKTPAATRSAMPSTASAMPDAGVLTPTILLSTLGIALLLWGLGLQIKITEE